MKSVFLVGVLACFLFVSCNGTEEKDEPQTPEPEQKVENKDNKAIEVLFDEVAFHDEQSLAILRELGEGICNDKEKDLENYIRPACNPKFFKIFPFIEKTPMKDAFVLLIKARVHDFPLRRTFIYQREGKKLVKVNGFAANLIGMRKSASKHDDLILRFNDKDQNHFNCLYVWRSNHYEFEKVEEINDAKIKQEFQDSMNVVIHKEIELNGMQQL